MTSFGQGSAACGRCNQRAREFETFSTIDDIAWDLKAYTGWSPSLPGIVVAFRGTDSHSIGNWVENMRYWRTDFKFPYPGANGSKVHTGELAGRVSQVKVELHPGCGSFLVCNWRQAFCVFASMHAHASECKAFWHASRSCHPATVKDPACYHQDCFCS